ncbi:helix-turn-helix domain-containing protein [Embleya sp. MST-111070]|uniref:helix-turn-helix domain-containing protein n=1 Tax=Embleya sp. MST-111070 TaxID=3398231 RepID=UPI003F73AD97
MRTTTQESTPEQDQINRFADWFEQRLIARHYDVSPRGGGRARFAADAKISPSTVSRILLRQSIPDPSVLKKIADGLGDPLGEVLLRAGVVDESQLQRAARPVPMADRISPEEAADRLGIHSEERRDLLISMIKTLQEQEQRRPSTRRRST